MHIKQQKVSTIVLCTRFTFCFWSWLLPRSCSFWSVCPPCPCQPQSHSPAFICNFYQLSFLSRPPDAIGPSLLSRATWPSSPLRTPAPSFPIIRPVLIAASPTCPAPDCSVVRCVFPCAVHAVETHCCHCAFCPPACKSLLSSSDSPLKSLNWSQRPACLRFRSLLPVDCISNCDSFRLPAPCVVGCIAGVGNGLWQGYRSCAELMHNQWIASNDQILIMSRCRVCREFLSGKNDQGSLCD